MKRVFWKFKGQQPQFKSPQQEQEDWQFRIKVAPKDLEAAAEILDNYLGDYEWKHFCFEGFATDLEKERALDATFTAADRDQRFKTVCVYIKPKQENNENHTKSLKAILLTCWKEMQRAGISLNYQTASGDQPIVVTTEDGDAAPTPFSYTSNKPYQQRHRILHETNYNPGQYQDPLEGLSFTFDDLDKYEIDYSPLAIALNTYQRAIQHVEDAENRLQDDLNMCCGAAAPQEVGTQDVSFDLIDKVINQIKEFYKNNKEDSDKKTSKELTAAYGEFMLPMRELIARFPYNVVSDDLSPDADGLAIFTANAFKEARAPIDDFNAVLDGIKFRAKKELIDITCDYHNAGQQRSGIFSLENALKIERVCARAPRMAQFLYRGQSHVQHEKEECQRIGKFIETRLKSSLQRLLNGEMDRLNSASWNPFKRSDLLGAKRRALTLLQEEFNDINNKGKTVDEIVGLWLAKTQCTYKTKQITNAELISYRSNSFFVKKINPASAGEEQEKTDTLRFVEGLKRSYGSYKI